MTASPVRFLAEKFIRTSTPIEPKSVGTYVGKIGKFGHHCWEAKTSFKSLFKSQIRPEILQYLEGRFDSFSTQDFITVTLYMIGRRSSTAAPTVLFVSENEDNRKSARKLIKECGILAQYQGWKTAQASQDPSWGAKLEQLASGLGPYQGGQRNDPAIHVLYDPSQPITSQGQPLYIPHDSDLRTATANLIRLHGKAFYLMPAHAFFKKPENMEPTPDSVDDDFEIDSDEETETNWGNNDDEDADDTIRDLGFDDIDGWSSSDQSSISGTFSTEDSDDDIYSQSSLGSFGMMDTAHTSDPYEIPDDEDLRETRSKPRYSARELHKPTQSSLLPFGVLSKWSTDKDWALVEVNADTDPTLSAFLRTHKGDLSTIPVASHGVAGAAVVSRTISSGELTGTILSTPSDARLPGGTSFQEVFSIRLEGPLADGDCGSIVIDAFTGELYGHIIAGCRETGFAYVMPASYVRLDLQKATTTSVTAIPTVVRSTNSSCRGSYLAMGSSTVPRDGMPMRLLCLDGGGVRGLSSLFIIQSLMKMIAQAEQQIQVEEGQISGSDQAQTDGNELLPCHFFDYMYGTSTGGLISTMLARLRMSVPECLETYRRMCPNYLHSFRDRLSLLKRCEDPYQSGSPDSGGLSYYRLSTAGGLVEEDLWQYARKCVPLTDGNQSGLMLWQPLRASRERRSALPSWSWTNEALEEAARKEGSDLDELDALADEPHTYRYTGALGPADLWMFIQAFIYSAMASQLFPTKLLKATKDIRSIHKRLLEGAEDMRTALEYLECSFANGADLDGPWSPSTDRYWECSWAEPSHTNNDLLPQLTAANLRMLQDMHQSCTQEPTFLFRVGRPLDVAQPPLDSIRHQYFSRNPGYSSLSRNSIPGGCFRFCRYGRSMPAILLGRHQYFAQPCLRHIARTCTRCGSHHQYTHTVEDPRPRCPCTSCEHIPKESAHVPPHIHSAHGSQEREAKCCGCCYARIEQGE